jgi:hypothetical protein
MSVFEKVGDWETCDTHYRYHVNKKVTPHSQFTRANENPDFWSSYAIKLSGSAAPAVETDKTMNALPPASIRNFQVSYSVIAHETLGRKHLQQRPLLLKQQQAPPQVSATLTTIKMTTACNS